MILGGAWLSTKALSRVQFAERKDSTLGRAADVDFAGATRPKVFINPSPRVLLLPRLEMNERASSSCSPTSLMVSSVSQGAGEWKRIVGPRKLIRGSESSSSESIDSGDGLLSGRALLGEAVKDLTVSKEGRAY